MSEFLDVRWEGHDGSVWHLSGENEENEGVILLPKPTKLMDASVQTLWVNGRYRSRYQDFIVQRRDPVLAFQIWGEGDIDQWEARESNFRKSWSYRHEGKLWFKTAKTERHLGLRLLQEPIAYEGATTNGFDPHIMGDTDLIITAAAEIPYYIGKKVVDTQVAEGASHTFEFEVENDGDVEMWLWWTASSVTAGTKYTVPDYSFGEDEYLRAVEDAERVVPLPALMAGEHITATADPEEEFVISTLDTNVWARCEGNGLRYPIPPHTPPTKVYATMTNGTAGDALRLTYTPRYSRPWGVSRK